MKVKFSNLETSDIFVHFYAHIAHLVCWKCQNSKFVRKLKKFNINVVIKLKDLYLYGVWIYGIISSYLFAKFIHLRKVSDGGASQGGCVLHQHHLAPVLLHLDHLPIQPLGSQVVEGSHGNGTIFVSEIHFNAWNSCQCVHTLLCTQPATCGGWWWAGQRTYRVNIEWSGAREQNNKSEN